MLFCRDSVSSGHSGWPSLFALTIIHISHTLSIGLRCECLHTGADAMSWSPVKLHNLVLQTIELAAQ